MVMHTRFCTPVTPIRLGVVAGALVFAILCCGWRIPTSSPLHADEPQPSSPNDAARFPNSEAAKKETEEHAIMRIKKGVETLTHKKPDPNVLKAVDWSEGDKKKDLKYRHITVGYSKGFDSNAKKLRESGLRNS